MIESRYIDDRIKVHSRKNGEEGERKNGGE
jgi:hypothetical protein